MHTLSEKFCIVLKLMLKSWPVKTVQEWRPALPAERPKIRAHSWGPWPRERREPEPDNQLMALLKLLFCCSADFYRKSDQLNSQGVPNWDLSLVLQAEDDLKTTLHGPLTSCNSNIWREVWIFGGCCRYYQPIHCVRHLCKKVLVLMR